MAVRTAAAVDGAALCECQQRCAAVTAALAAAELEAEDCAAGKALTCVTSPSLTLAALTVCPGTRPWIGRQILMRNLDQGF